MQQHYIPKKQTKSNLKTAINHYPNLPPNSNIVFIKTKELRKKIYCPKTQSLLQTIDSIVYGLSELWNWSRTQSPTLKAYLDATVDTKIVKTSRAIEVSSR